MIAKGTAFSGVAGMRRLILELSMAAHVGHIGCSLSVADILYALYTDVLRIEGPRDPDRDRFVMSKGHAALALYIALYMKGFVREEQLRSFCTDGSLLGVHPERALPGVDFCTGSLGHGLSMAAGCALAARMQRSKRRVFALLSDAECNQGSTWEAIMVAAHHKLSQLVVIVDLNGQQALGMTDDILKLSPMDERWRAFGWDVHVVDGHDAAGLSATMRGLDFEKGPPHVILAKTILGKGVSFMERQVKWHYWPLNNEEYELALSEVGGCG